MKTQSQLLVAPVASALFEDSGLVTHDDMSNVIDRHKIRSERKLYHVERQVQHFIFIATSNLKGLYFDGRKNQTLKHINIEGTLHKQRALERQVTLIEETLCKYLGHMPPIPSSAKKITESMTEF